MQLSIRVKLFLTFLLTTFLVVAGMFLFMRWSLIKGFNELIEARENERVSQIIESLSDYYATTGSWERLASNKRQWIRLLQLSDDHRKKRLPPWSKQALQDPSNRWPPAFPEDVPRRRLIKPLELRVMLLDANRAIIFGHRENLPALSLNPISHEQQIIGYLGLLPGKPDNPFANIRFLEKQSKAFAVIALTMIVLSGLLATLLAYILGRPVKRITAAAKQLTVGRYDIRLPTGSGDELGQLARDFNEMAATLGRSEEARRQWVADISHELRTPLAILRGELEALQDGIRPMNGAAIDSLLGDVMRLNRLTEDLYQLALSDQGALTYRKIMLDPLEILAEDLTAMSPEFDKKNIRTNFHNHCTKEPTLYADPDRLSQLFRNLMRNSASYTYADGAMEITASCAGDRLIIDVADSQPGVPEIEREQLFERFYRVESSRNRNHGGAGLGLAICRNIVDAHQGRIEAQESALGGVNIHIEFPLTA